MGSGEVDKMLRDCYWNREIIVCLTVTLRHASVDYEKVICKQVRYLPKLFSAKKKKFFFLYK